MNDDEDRFHTKLTGLAITVFMGILLILSAIMLHGCAPAAVDRPSVQVQLPPVPDSQFECRDEPAAPAGAPTDLEDAEMTRELRDAWKDCRTKLYGTGRLWREAERSMSSRAIPPEEGEVK